MAPQIRAMEGETHITGDRCEGRASQSSETPESLLCTNQLSGALEGSLGGTAHPAVRTGDTGITAWGAAWSLSELSRNFSPAGQMSGVRRQGRAGVGAARAGDSSLPGT